MALYNEILVGRYNRFFQKFFGMKGGPPVPQLGGEVTPSFPLFSGVENRTLEAWTRFATAQGVAALGAGTNSNLRLRNPKGSNVVAVFEKILVISAAVVDDLSVQYQLGGATDLATPLSVYTVRLDPRGTTQPTLLATTGNAVSTGFTAMSAHLLANTSWDFITNENQELPLFPDDSLQIHGNIQNQAIGVSLLWRERLLEEGERA